jgi:hypothetical protein
MACYVGSMFHRAGILPTFLHIFLATISAMELKFKQFVILVADLHVYHAIVLEELVIVGLSMELHWAIFYKTFLVVFTLLLTALTLYHHLYWFHTQAMTRTGNKTMCLISICLNWGSKYF